MSVWFLEVRLIGMWRWLEKYCSVRRAGEAGVTVCHKPTLPVDVQLRLWESPLAGASLWASVVRTLALLVPSLAVVPSLCLRRLRGLPHVPGHSVLSWSDGQMLPFALSPDSAH